MRGDRSIKPSIYRHFVKQWRALPRLVLAVLLNKDYVNLSSYGRTTWPRRE
jgi:hypothetical protein